MTAACLFCLALGSLGTLSVTFLPQSGNSSHRDESALGCSPTSFRDGKAEVAGFGGSVVFGPCHMVSPTARPPFSTWQLCFDLAGGPADCHQGWWAGLYFQSSVCALPANFISLVLAISSHTPSPVTVVCYQSDRDELRRRVIQWLEAEIIPDGWFSKGSNYSEVLDKYFKASRAAPASEAREHFLPCHCKAAAMPPHPRGSSV